MDRRVNSIAVYTDFRLDYVHNQQLKRVILLKINNYVPSTTECVLAPARHVVENDFRISHKKKFMGVYGQLPSWQLVFTRILIVREDRYNPM